MASPAGGADYGDILRERSRWCRACLPRRPARARRQWISYLYRRREQTERWVAGSGRPPRRGAVPLGRAAPSTAQKRTSSPPPSSSRPGPETESLARIDVLDREERRSLLGALVRAGQPPLPPRQRLRCPARRFEIVSDYGAFRPAAAPDATARGRLPHPDLGAGIPERCAKRGVGGEFERALEVSRGETSPSGRRPGRHAPYRSAAYRSATRSTSTTARLALIARSGRAGHPPTGRWRGDSLWIAAVPPRGGRAITRRLFVEPRLSGHDLDPHPPQGFGAAH